MKISDTYLRQHVYEILDRVLLTGESVEIERHGKIIRLAPETQIKTRKVDLSKIPERNDIFVGEPEDYVHFDWYEEWKP